VYATNTNPRKKEKQRDNAFATSHASQRNSGHFDGLPQLFSAKNARNSCQRGFWPITALAFLSPADLPRLPAHFSDTSYPFLPDLHWSRTPPRVLRTRSTSGWSSGLNCFTNFDRLPGIRNCIWSGLHLTRIMVAFWGFGASKEIHG
jgi:hypothetical protein